ncbi:hypothetical protein B0H12DRAFT_1310393 [Mycena haematopus]|nr:hypothetical protein B0H12DRAFT_1310393 [Mycena haematopus]
MASQGIAEEHYLTLLPANHPRPTSATTGHWRPPTNFFRTGISLEIVQYSPITVTAIGDGSLPSPPLAVATQSAWHFYLLSWRHPVDGFCCSPGRGTRRKSTPRRKPLRVDPGPFIFHTSSMPTCITAFSESILLFHFILPLKPIHRLEIVEERTEKLEFPGIGAGGQGPFGLYASALAFLSVSPRHTPHRLVCHAVDLIQLNSPLPGSNSPQHPVNTTVFWLTTFISFRHSQKCFPALMSMGKSVTASSAHFRTLDFESGGHRSQAVRIDRNSTYIPGDPLLYPLCDSDASAYLKIKSFKSVENLDQVIATSSYYKSSHQVMPVTSSDDAFSPHPRSSRLSEAVAEPLGWGPNIGNIVFLRSVLFHFIQFVWSQVTGPKIYEIFPEACRAPPRVADGSNSQMGTAYERFFIPSELPLSRHHSIKSELVSRIWYSGSRL